MAIMRSVLVRRSPLAIVYLTVFIDLLGFGIILPILPFYAEKLGATGVWVGAILTAYSAAQLAAAPLLGRLSDRIGRRPIILLSLAGSAVSFTVTGFAGSLAVLLLGRGLAGLFGGSIATAQAYVADTTAPAERAKYMGILGAAIGMGFVFGPAVGAGLSGFGFSTAAFVAAGLAAANLVFGFFALPESVAGDERRVTSGVLRGPCTSPPATRHPSPVTRHAGGLIAAFRQPALGRILASTFLATFAFVGMEATFALFGEQRFGLDGAHLGLIFAFVGVVIVVVQGGLLGRLSARFGERALATAGAIVMGLALLALPLTGSLAIALVVLGGLAVGQGLVTPSLSSLLSREGRAHEQGATLGLGQSLSAAARAIGPLTAGWLFDLGIALPYFAGAALVLLAAWSINGVAMPVDERAVQPVRFE